MSSGSRGRAGKKNVAVTAIDSVALLDHDEAIVLHGRNSHRGHQGVEDPGEAVPVECMVDNSDLAPDGRLKGSQFLPEEVMRLLMGADRT